jgi:hypothetical protein
MRGERQFQQTKINEHINLVFNSTENSMKNNPEDKSRVKVAEWKAGKPNVPGGCVISRAPIFSI